MKQKLLFIVVTLFILNSPITAQFISLPGNWLFKTGDSIAYKENGFDDSGWEYLMVPGNWENQGYPDYNGYAWYRVHFHVDKKNLQRKLFLLLGKIDDEDETFLNGELVGSMGKFPPNDETAWNEQRAYAIPAGLLKENNVLAIRMYDGQGGGGLHSGLIGIFDKPTSGLELNSGPAPKKSFYQITTSNGLISAVYNENLNIVESVTPHIFQMYDLGKPVKPFLRYLQLADGKKPLAVEYVKNSHVIKINYGDYTLYYFAPFSINEKVFFAVAEGNLEKIKDVEFTFEKDQNKILEKTILLKNKNNPAQKYFLFSFNDSLHNNANVIERVSNKKILKNLLNDEVTYMRNVFRKARIPIGLNKDERNLYEQSIAVIKMAQVSQKEIFEKSRGQILASLPPGNWNIGWLRDATYAILALNKLHLFDEAKNVLNFFLHADAGYYKNYIWKDGIDYGVKVDYRLSVCRYFGIGKEESDFNEKGPNVELDGFGLFLTAFSDYVNTSGDKKFLKDNYETVSKLVADPILTFIEPNNLIRKDSGPWEMHLPGVQQSFTTIVNAAGLRDFGALLKKHHHKNFQKYFDGCTRLTSGIKQNLIYDGKMLKGFSEAKTRAELNFYDGGVIEAFSQNLLNDKKLFNSNYNEYEKGLRIDKRRGFSRLNNPDWYTISEWPFLDLRMAIGLNNFGRKTEAKYLIDAITGYAKLNFNFIAELYDYKDENYGGAVPMIGYGAGAYILSINNYYNK